MLRKTTDNTLHSIDIKNHIIIASSKYNKSKKIINDYNFILNRISSKRIPLGNNLNLKAGNNENGIDEDMLKLKVYRSKIENRDEKMKRVNSTPNGKFNEILKMKEAFDEAKKRLDKEIENKNDIFYCNIIKLSDKLDKIIDKSIK